MVGRLLAISVAGVLLAVAPQDALASCQGEFNTGIRHYNAGNDFNKTANSAINKLNAELRRGSPRRLKYCDYAVQAETSYDNAFRWYNRAETHFGYAVISCKGGNKSTARKNERIAANARKSAGRAEDNIRSWRNKNCR